MRHHLVEQDHWRGAGHVGDQRRVGEHQSDQQRFLLAGGSVARRDSLFPIAHHQVGQMRTFETASGGRIARAVFFEYRAIAVFYFHSRVGQDHRLHPAVDRDLGGRKPKSRFTPGRQRGGESPRCFGARRGDRNRNLGGFMLGGVKPMRIGMTVLQQPVTRTQGALQTRHPRAMGCVHGEYEPVEKSPPLRGGPEKQAVHAGDQPHHAQVIRERSRRGDGLAVDPVLSGQHRFPGYPRLDTGPQRCQA